MDRERRILELHPQPEKNIPRHSESSLIRLKDNSIMLMYNQYVGASNNDLDPDNIVARYSYDEGETWTEPEIVFSPKDFGVTNIGSPSLVRMLNGDLGVLFNCPIKSETASWVRHKIFARSSDEGKTWGGYIECSSELFDGRSGINNDRMKRLASGRLMYPHSIHPGCFKEWDKVKRKPQPTSHTNGNFIYSDDDGYTWKTSKETIFMPFTGSNPGLQEGEIFEIQPGVLKCFFRTSKMYQYVSISFDNGEHWTVAQPSCFTSPCSPITIRKNPYSGKIYAFWNPIPQYNGTTGPKKIMRRAPLAIAEMNSDVSQIVKMEYVHSDHYKAGTYNSVLFINEKEAILAYGSGDERLGERSLDTLVVSKVDLDF